MATEGDIARHDRLLNRVAKAYDRLLAGAYQSVLNNLLALGLTTNRLQILEAFQPITPIVEQIGQSFDSVLNSIVDTNSDTIDPAITSETVLAVTTLKNQTINALNAAISVEQNRIIDIVVLSAIAGSGLLYTTEIRSAMKKSLSRMQLLSSDSIFKFNNIMVRVRGQSAGIRRYRYVGGLIATSRDFCSRHNDKVYTEREIQSIWRGNWGGKAPGDPFVVRGGYNCRHHWIPVRENRASS